MIPPRVGRYVGQLLGQLAARVPNYAHAQAVRANQWVVHGYQLTAAELEQQTRKVFKNAGRFLYDFYHFIDRPKDILAMTEFDESFERLLTKNKEGDEPIFIVVPHMTNLDFIGRAAALKGLQMQVLSYPQPPVGYRIQNRLRSDIPGVNVTPLSIEALRKATEHLRSGGTVLTGLDRPLDETRYRPCFFGRPATLPVSHIRLALKLGIPVRVVSGELQDNGRYRVWASEPIHMQPDTDLHTELVMNAEKVLAVTADYIRKAPDQWVMYYPVWPEALKEIPNP
jgi:KDO2-lipid IV(A) lauroyltransferase